MIIDTHLHTAEYSTDSHLPIGRAIARAREMGLDGLCITDHDTLAARRHIDEWRKRYRFPLFLGTEVLTSYGDIVCFGLAENPRPAAITPEELLIWVGMTGGAAVAVHPYRMHRALRDKITTLRGLHGVECYNACTAAENNLRAVDALRAAGKTPAILGGGDAHEEKHVGLYATEFHGDIRDERDLIAAIKECACHPVAWNGQSYVDAEEFTRALAHK